MTPSFPSLLSSNILITVFVHAEVDAEHLTEEELVGFCLLLLVAGHETTANRLSNSAVILAQHPEDRRALADEPELVPAAVEELPRYDSPVQGLARTLTRQVQLPGQAMAAGDHLLLPLGSPNRDYHASPYHTHFSIPPAPARRPSFRQAIPFYSRP